MLCPFTAASTVSCCVSNTKITGCKMTLTHTTICVLQQIFGRKSSSTYVCTGKSQVPALCCSRPFFWVNRKLGCLNIKYLTYLDDFFVCAVGGAKVREWCVTGGGVTVSVQQVLMTTAVWRPLLDQMAWLDTKIRTEKLMKHFQRCEPSYVGQKVSQPSQNRNLTTTKIKSSPHRA